jgi:hypothetical protein
VGSGKHTHVYHPEKGTVICNSGKNAGRVGHAVEEIVVSTPDGGQEVSLRHLAIDRRGGAQQIFGSDAHFITCYRCQKLAHMNLEQGRPAWQGPGG